MQQRPVTATFPKSVRAAGIIWIVFGIVGALDSALQLMVGVVSIWRAVFAVAFLVVGVQTVKGSIRFLLGISLFSAALGGLCSLMGVVLLEEAFDPVGRSTTTDPVLAVMVFCNSLGLFTAGTLALVGRRAFRNWQDMDIADPPSR